MLEPTTIQPTVETVRLSSEETLLVKAGGRKYILSVLSLLSASLLVYFGKIDSGVYSTVMVATVAAYITGNVYQKTNITK